MNETKFINYGITNFDLIPYAALTVFITFRMQNWVKLLDIVKLIFIQYQDNSSIPTILYFLTTIIIGGFFLIKIIIAVQNECLHSSITPEEEEDKFINLYNQNEENKIELANLINSLENNQKPNKSLKEVEKSSLPIKTYNINTNNFFPEKTIHNNKGVFESIGQNIPINEASSYSKFNSSHNT